MEYSGPADWGERIVGFRQQIPLRDGRLARYVHLDNAASTPPLRDVVEAVERFLPYYSSVHRGTGFKSRLSTAIYDDAHDVVARFVGADPAEHATIFGKNTTEAINKLAWRLPLAPDSVVITTEMEHHSNELPWRSRATVVRARVTADGRLDEDHVDHLLAKYGERVALLTVSGASNVTGYVQPIHRLARKAHDAGARILIDAAQLAPHRPIEVKRIADPEHLDFVALSAHKMYAPFGTGALIGCKDVFLTGDPEYRGGGMVEIVTPEDVEWAGLPDREEAGSPNVVGAVAMAAAAQALSEANIDQLACHERALTVYAVNRLQTVDGLVLYGEHAVTASDRVGVITFNLTGVHHALVAAILGYEAGIGVRNGCFCAQMYVARLLGLSHDDLDRWHRAYRQGDRTHKPGMVRVSFGAFNTTDDVDFVVEMLQRIVAGEYRAQYRQIGTTGEFVPEGERDDTYSAVREHDGSSHHWQWHDRRQFLPVMPGR